MKPENRISKRFAHLFLLTERKDFIQVSDLRKEFRKDLQNFIIGETLTLREGKVVIGKNTYKKWLEKIKTKGFDYDISLI